MHTDRATFSELLHDHHNAAYSQALSLLRDPHLAQDAVQEAFLAAYLSLETLSDAQAFTAWLRTIVHYQCHRILRRRDLHWVHLDNAPQLMESSTLGPHMLAEQSESRAALQTLLTTLDPGDRELLALFYLKECSQRDIASFLHLPITSVNNRLRAARNKLKERMTTMPASTSLKPNSIPEGFSQQIGRLMSIAGPLIDVRFDKDATPDIFDALTAPDLDGNPIERMKVAQRPGDGIVRCIATAPISDLRPGSTVHNTRALGVGLTPWIGVAPFSDEHMHETIQTLSPSSSTKPALFETGIKSLDLFCPISQAGHLAIFGIQGVGRIVLVEELLRRISSANHQTNSPISLFYLVHPNEPDSVRDMLTKEKGYPGDVVPGAQVLWLLSPHATDPLFASTEKLFDAVAYCSPLLAIQGLFPAIDPLASTSRLLDPSIVGREHADLVAELRALLTRAKSLMADPLLLEYIACRSTTRARERSLALPSERFPQLSDADRLLVTRARKIERFLSTPFFVAEPFNNRPGAHVPLTQTIRGCRAILSGEFDDLPEHAFQFIGPVEEAVAKAGSLAR